jgi:hypothetical protein
MAYFGGQRVGKEDSVLEREKPVFCFWGIKIISWVYKIMAIMGIYNYFLGIYYECPNMNLHGFLKFIYGYLDKVES